MISKYSRCLVISSLLFLLSCKTTLNTDLKVSELEKNKSKVDVTFTADLRECRKDYPQIYEKSIKFITCRPNGFGLVSNIWATKATVVHDAKIVYDDHLSLYYTKNGSAIFVTGTAITERIKEELTRGYLNKDLVFKVTLYNDTNKERVVLVKGAWGNGLPTGMQGKKFRIQSNELLGIVMGDVETALFLSNGYIPLFLLEE